MRHRRHPLKDGEKEVAIKVCGDRTVALGIVIVVVVIFPGREETATWVASCGQRLEKSNSTEWGHLEKLHKNPDPRNFKRRAIIPCVGFNGENKEEKLKTPNGDGDQGMDSSGTSSVQIPFVRRRKIEIGLRAVVHDPGRPMVHPTPGNRENGNHKHHM
jgi:hypothetical protein